MQIQRLLCALPSRYRQRVHVGVDCQSGGPTTGEIPLVGSPRHVRAWQLCPVHTHDAPAAAHDQRQGEGSAGAGKAQVGNGSRATRYENEELNCVER